MRERDWITEDEDEWDDEWGDDEWCWGEDCETCLGCGDYRPQGDHRL